MNGAPARLLVVDDEELNRRLLLRRLERRQHAVTLAENGQQALNLLDRSAFDLVLLDIMMPGMSGFDVLTAIRRRHNSSDLPVIMATARDASADIVRALQLGANDYVTKPFDFAVLSARIDTQVRLKQAVAELDRAYRQLQDDLSAAAKVQQRLLPQATPQPANVEFAWKYKPCDTLGGDILNVFELAPPHMLGLYLLDVSGHGVQAALLSSTLSRVISPAAAGEQAVLTAARPDKGTGHVPPASVCERLNRRFQMDPVTLQYFTMLYGVLDLEAPRFSYAAAGHPGPVVLAPDGTATHFPTTGSAIGLFRDPCCEEVSIPLEPRCRVFLFSDGVTEAPRGDEEFGVKRVIEAAVETREMPLDAALGDILDRVLRWAGADRDDDMSLLAFELKAAPTG